MNELQGQRVLLVDDEPRVREAIAWLFEALGGRVTHAGSASEALAVFRPGAFALVSTDYTMPGTDGIELIKAILRLAPGQKIIMISGYVDRLRGNEELLGKIGALLSKPCSLGDLAATLRRMGFPQADVTALPSAAES